MNPSTHDFGNVNPFIPSVGLTKGFSRDGMQKYLAVNSLSRMKHVIEGMLKFSKIYVIDLNGGEDMYDKMEFACHNNITVDKFGVSSDAEDLYKPRSCVIDVLEKRDIIFPESKDNWGVPILWRSTEVITDKKETADMRDLKNFIYGLHGMERMLRGENSKPIELSQMSDLGYHDSISSIATSQTAITTKYKKSVSFYRTRSWLIQHGFLDEDQFEENKNKRKGSTYFLKSKKKMKSNDEVHQKLQETVSENLNHTEVENDAEELVPGQANESDECGDEIDSNRETDIDNESESTISTGSDRHCQEAKYPLHITRRHMGLFPSSSFQGCYLKCDVLIYMDDSRFINALCKLYGFINMDLLLAHSAKPRTRKGYNGSGTINQLASTYSREVDQKTYRYFQKILSEYMVMGYSNVVVCSHFSIIRSKKIKPTFSIAIIEEEDATILLSCYEFSFNVIVKTSSVNELSLLDYVSYLNSGLEKYFGTKQVVPMFVNYAGKILRMYIHCVSMIPSMYVDRYSSHEVIREIEDYRKQHLNK